MRTLTFERVELNGATKTTLGSVYRHLDLQPGDPITQDGLWVAADRLRRSGLFEAVDHYTRAGSERGHLILVLEVEERGVEWRFGTGNSDMDGWYVIPAELNLDNWNGHGERMGAQFRAGYRLLEFGLHYGRGHAPSDRLSWMSDLTLGVLDQVYFKDGVEYSHPVARGGLGFAVNRKLGDGWRLGAGLRFESVHVDSTGYARRTEEWAGVEAGDDVLFEDLPAEIAAAVGEHETTTLRLDLEHDAVSSERWAESPVSGFWGRLRMERVQREDGDYGRAELDLRTYRPWGDGVLAVRGRAAVVDEDAPFYDRLYLGGLYTVRGVPSQSLSPVGGSTHLWHTSAEYRMALYGDPRRPRLAGLLFLDAGRAGDSGRDVSVTAGWGLRIRLGWLGWIGTDIAFPLTDSPVNESFHTHADLSWSF